MRRFVQRAAFWLMLVAVFVSVLTSLPTWFDGHLGGYRLMVHMMASGLIVAALPVYAILRWSEWWTDVPRGVGEPIAFWTMIVFGFLTIASMFACMLPVASTSMMRELIDLHGWFGSVLAIAVIAHLGLHRRGPIGTIPSSHESVEPTP